MLPCGRGRKDNRLPQQAVCWREQLTPRLAHFLGSEPACTDMIVYYVVRQNVRSAAILCSQRSEKQVKTQLTRTSLSA